MKSKQEKIFLIEKNGIEDENKIENLSISNENNLNYY